MKDGSALRREKVSERERKRETHIHTHTEREREREREMPNETSALGSSSLIDARDKD